MPRDPAHHPSAASPHARARQLGDTADLGGLGQDLSVAEREELSKILEDYLTRLEQGTGEVEAGLLARHPQLADQLSAHLSSLRVLHQAAVGLVSPVGAGAPQPRLPEGNEVLL